MQNPYIRKMYKAMIFDDEASASAVLKLMINRYIPRINEIRIANNFDAAMQMLEDFKPDLLFLDIMMPGKTGFEFLSSLQEIDFDIIFTTASDEFAIRAIRFSALDYLLKPIDIVDLQN
nr:response regulator [Saprospiraceae bacterium]